MKVIKNLPASVHSKLLDSAKQQGRPFNEILLHYAMQRFLFRLSKSAHSKDFILKGAFLLKAWGYADNRPTMNIDLLGKTENSEQNIVSKIKGVIETETEPDGLVFDANSIICEQIAKETNYTGTGVSFLCFLDTAQIPIKIDIGFGDVIYPKAEFVELDSVIGFSAAKIRSYSRESAIAEKFHAIFKLGTINSRMKDFYDIWILSEKYAFNGETLSIAISKTFTNRKTALTENIIAFTPEFAKDKQKQWGAFCKKMLEGPAHVSHNFGDVITSIQKFIMPVIVSLTDRHGFRKNWEVEKKKWKSL
ncbi:MAG: nucleotidyl transferase AbiEii/AbiGii toxin family protein [Chitinispirillia bacterium]|nr:nucleotidyl transferase AbiEii/AbiGii toxin family protein [Chitinispirillia bacterium]MCL2241247.1 nucleotidyl transferase AbiEii/AbiGii toxin family protein [Chitinispirillia bacterium]